MKKIFIIATFDTKSQEAIFLKNIISELNLPVLSVDISTAKKNSNADIQAFDVAKFHPQGTTAVFCGDRGKAITAMGVAFKEFVKSNTEIGAMLGIGGSGGTSMICEGMQELAIGIPKIMVSTMASQDISSYIGGSDIAMLYSVTDFVNINSISSKILANAAGAIAGSFIQATQTKKHLKTLPAIGITMFGVTTPCVESITTKLQNNYDCLVFHATGAGGKSMEKLLDSGFFEGIIDLTTTEVCDYLFGGVLACTNDRFGAIARTKKPAIVSCGALDMINFGSFDSVPQQFKNRLLYKHNPEVTLMRTNIAENTKIGEWIANKINQCNGEIRFIIPEGGVSALDAETQPFWDPEANAALFSAISKNLHLTNKRKLIKAPYHINSPEFSQLVVEQFHSIMSINEELICQNTTV